MWRRALESNGEMRTRRCTPNSVFSQPWAFWPLIDEGRRLDAGFVAGRFFDHLDLELAPLAPAHVHAQQHARPVAAFRAAGAGVDFDIAVVAVGLAREQRFELPPLALRPLAPCSAASPSFSVAASPSDSPSSTSVFASSSSRSILASEPSRSSSIVRSRISFCAASGSFQRLGSSDLALSSARRRVAVVDVKDASSAVPRTA